MSERQRQTTHLLNRFLAGDPSGGQALSDQIHEELRALAAHALGPQAQAHTLSPTALVNEAWMRLVNQDDLQVDGRARFFALASKVIRSVLVDYERARAAQKRGGGMKKITLLTGFAEVSSSPETGLLELDEALARLAEFDPEAARLVELRFFTGLPHEEIAELLGTSKRTVERRWRTARAWLHLELSSQEG